jgi:molybdopterin molybdotransferase
MRTVITVEDALAIVARATKPLSIEEVRLPQARGRVLARDVTSDVDWPPFDTSAMDGYAVHVRDAAQAGAALPARAEVVAAGAAPPAPLAPGEAVRVMTGAPIPEGTEAIVPVELLRIEGQNVVFEQPAVAGAHIRRRGESVAAGRALVRAGKRVSPGIAALAALAGRDPLEVFRRPRVRVVATGNELVPASQRPGPGQLRDSNGPMLASLCAESGWPFDLAERVVDEVASVDRLFAEAGSGEDVIITSGGVSAGDLDLLPAAAHRSGFQVLFHGVAVRPGKPIIFARRGETLWIGLPGNPVSSAVAFHLFVRFALGRLEGDAQPGAPRVTARLARDLKAAGARETYRDARLTVLTAGLSADPLPSRGSHDIAAHAGANALIRQPAGQEGLAAGALVECLVTGELQRP